jgi:glycerate dehydrogenase
VADIARAFGMEPVFAAHKNVSGLGPLYTPWDEVIATSDVLSLHAPLTASTRNCLDKAEFDRMHKKPLIINTARGGLVDEQAMVDALHAGQISGIGFDVLSTEPPAEDNPLLSVMDRPDVLLTPHIAWASVQARQEVWRQTIAHIDAFQRGEAVNALN